MSSSALGSGRELVERCKVQLRDLSLLTSAATLPLIRCGNLLSDWGINNIRYKFKFVLRNRNELLYTDFDRYWRHVISYYHSKVYWILRFKLNAFCLLYQTECMRMSIQIQCMFMSSHSLFRPMAGEVLSKPTNWTVLMECIIDTNCPICQNERSICMQLSNYRVIW